MTADEPELIEGGLGERSDAGGPNRLGPGGSVTFQSQRTIGTLRLLTVREVAGGLRVSRATVYRLVAEGRMPDEDLVLRRIGGISDELPMPHRLVAGCILVELESVLSHAAASARDPRWGRPGSALGVAMSRKPSSFDAFMQEVEEETRAAGPQAQTEAEAVRDHFRLAAQVLRRRRELGLSQQQLAAAVGVHQSEISNIERGASQPGYRTLSKLAHGLQAELALVPWKRTPRPTRGKARVVGRRRARVATSARSVRSRTR